MIDFTPIARRVFSRRIAQLDALSAESVDAVQDRVLKFILGKLAKTQIGARLKIDSSWGYPEFCSRVPIIGYEDMRPWVMKMVNGERDVLWPGVVRRFAQSSGTSGGKSKYIPLTDDCLRLNHYQGGFDAVAHYLDMYPESRIFSGKALILGGSFANELAGLPRGVKVGDLSAHLIDKINPLANFFRVPDKKTALLSAWEEKLPRLAEAAAKEDITNLSGVPSWFLTVLQHIIRQAGARTIHDVWPNLEVFFHGGISFTPYRTQYADITDTSRMHYLETYNASEGFFAVQTARSGQAMELILDSGVFYEFLPIEQLKLEPGSSGEDPREPVRASQVEKGKTYALVITACNGLIRYLIGDTVRIESTDPLTITIAGRTQAFINAFGEEVMVFNTDRALARACAEHHCAAREYHAYPIFKTEHNARHHWIIEWSTPPSDPEAFADTLDRALQDENSDYQAKRQNSIFLDRLTFTSVPPGTFNGFLALTGRLGAQRKVPRLLSADTIGKDILNFVLKNKK